MNPDHQLLLMGSLVASLFALAIMLYFIKKERQHDSENSRRLAKDGVNGLIKEMSSPSRHRWVETPRGEMIQFIYLLLGRSKTRSETGHLVWAEVSLRRDGATVSLFHTEEIAPDDDFLVETATALRDRGWKVNVVKTDTQPNIDHTGVHPPR